MSAAALTTTRRRSTPSFRHNALKFHRCALLISQLNVAFAPLLILHEAFHHPPLHVAILNNKRQLSNTSSSHSTEVQPLPSLRRFHNSTLPLQLRIFWKYSKHRFPSPSSYRSVPSPPRCRVDKETKSHSCPPPSSNPTSHIHGSHIDEESKSHCCLLPSCPHRTAGKPSFTFVLTEFA